MQPKIVIKRGIYADQGTFGILTATIDNKISIQLRSLELPWRNNQRNLSCIPCGIYRAKLEYSNKFKRALWELKGITNRSEVKIHAGNYAGDIIQGFKSDVAGCILVGMGAVENTKSQSYITKSRHAEKLLHDFLDGYDTAEVCVISWPAHG